MSIADMAIFNPYIDLNAEYNIRSDWLKLAQKNNRKGNVYFKNNFKEEDIPDYSKIPFQSGKLIFFKKITEKDLRSPMYQQYKIVKVNNEKYRRTSSLKFNNNTDIKNPYEIAEKIDAIRKKDPTFLQGVKITHTGYAEKEHTNHKLRRIPLDLMSINKKFSELTEPTTQLPPEPAFQLLPPVTTINDDIPDNQELPQNSCLRLFLLLFSPIYSFGSMS